MLYPPITAGRPVIAYRCEMTDGSVRTFLRSDVGACALNILDFPETHHGPWSLVRDADNSVVAEGVLGLTYVRGTVG